MGSIGETVLWWAALREGVLVLIKVLGSDVGASLGKLLVDVGHKHVKELSGHGCVQGTRKSHLDMIVDEAARQRVLAIGSHPPL